MIQLRDAVPADFEALCALWRIMDDLHAGLLPRFFRRPGPTTPPRTRDQVERALRSGDERVRVAVLEEAVVALCHAQLYDTPPQPALTPCRRVHIDSLVVDDAVRRRGIGRRLVEDAAAWGRSRGASELVLTVWAGNQEAERFYAALGFARVSSVLGVEI